MSDEQFEIIIIGAGPGGLSAASRAAESDVSHVLLESSPKIANTIQKYQKGKHVMATPDILPLRSPIDFQAGKREAILEAWEKGIASHDTNVHYGAEVKKIEGSKGNFSVECSNGKVYRGNHIILGIGMQGNPRQLGVPGDQAEFVQYQLDDPDEYSNESIVIVGAGDAAIENAVALSENNKVYIVNRKDEFARAKEGNLNLILAAIESESIECFYGTTPNKVEETPEAERAGIFVLNTPSGEAQVPVDRIIARLGAIAPRGLVESFGIQFPNEDPNAIPALSSQYESNVEGMYVIGALGGYPLIKQAMNQGYEVVEYIQGNEVKPADHELIAAKFEVLPGDMEVDDVLSLMQERIPVFEHVNALQFREIILDSNVHLFKKGDLIFQRNDYTNSFYTVYEGDVEIEAAKDLRILSKQGSFFGEMSLLSGRRRSATVFAGDNCIVIETPRRTMNKLISSVDAVKRVLDQTFIVRTIQQKFAPDNSIEELMPVAENTVINVF